MYYTQCLNVTSESEIALLLGLSFAASQVEDNLNVLLLLAQFESLKIQNVYTCTNRTVYWPKAI